MSQMINRGKELIRISPKSATLIEYSINNGQSWVRRYSSSSCGDFKDLMNNGREILAQTSKGLYYSLNGGLSWVKRGV